VKSSLAGAKERVRACIDDDELIGLASELVPFQSWSDHERDCAVWLGEYMDRNGLEVELVDAEPGRPNVVGRVRGDGSGASLMFNGHLDVDPIPAGYQHDPWHPQIRDGKLFGHGLWNMKAGVASMVHAAIALKRSGIPLRGDLVVAGVVGELQCGVGTRALIEHGIITDVALVPEPSNMNVRTIHSGVLPVLIRVAGVSGWLGSLHKYKTVNAVDKMADVIRGLRNLHFSHPSHPETPVLPRFVVGTVIGGLGEDLNLRRPSYVPDTCYITVEVRMPPDMLPDEALEEIEDVLVQLRRQDPDLNVTLMGPPGTYREPWRAGKFFMPGIDLPKDHPLTTLVVRNYREVLGSDPVKVGAEDPGSCAGTDCGHLTAAGVKSLVLGPSGNFWGESYVELEKLSAHARIFASCAVDILTGPRDIWL
jgi:acetylornithine deacetylase